MHIDRTHQITVSRESTGTADPISAFGFVLLSTSGTLTRCSSFRASEAQDAGLFGFVDEILDILAILPQSHALIVVSAIITIADAVRIADEQTSHLVLPTEVDDLMGRLVSHIADTARGATAQCILRPLQFLPATGILLTTGLLLGNLAQSLGALPLQTANT